MSTSLAHTPPDLLRDRDGAVRVGYGKYSTMVNFAYIMVVSMAPRFVRADR